jgi:hypothetical protein
MKQNYVCTICAQDFTRKASANRHNATLHQGTAVIVRLVDYVVGRVAGIYQAADPKLYRRKPERKGYLSYGESHDKFVPTSFPDIIGETGSSIKYFNHTPGSTSGTPTGITTSKSESLHDTLDIAIKCFKFKKLANELQSPPLTAATLISNFVSSLSTGNQVFGFSGYSCPTCAYWAVHQLEFGKVDCVNTLEQPNHSCELFPGPENHAHGMLPFIVISLSRAWLNDQIYLLALEIPPTILAGRALYLKRIRSDSSTSILLPISKESPIVLEANDEGHWSARAVSSEKKSVPISVSELHDFLQLTGQSTYGLFIVQTLSKDFNQRQNKMYFFSIGRFSRDEDLLLQIVPDST